MTEETLTAERNPEPPPGAGSFRIPPDRLVQDWKGAHDRAVAYLEALGVAEHERATMAAAAVQQALHQKSWDSGSTAVGETFRALREALSQTGHHAAQDGRSGVDRFTAWRLATYLSQGGAARDGAEGSPFRGDTFSSMPKLMRGAMVPVKIERRVWRRVLNRLRGKRVRSRVLRHRRRQLPWTRVAHRRRFLLMLLVFLPSIIASGFMVNVLPQQGGTRLEVAIVFFFGALFGWISIGFWTAIFGFFILLRRHGRFAITNIPADEAAEFRSEGRTAIVMPICDEPVDRVFAGLKAIYQSLERSGAMSHFDFFILSDSGDPGTWVREEEAWADWCRSVGGFGRIFYRHRRVRLKRKSGNVADFCRRWGRRYRYMIMLDADSIMAGTTLVQLVRMMERHPRVGMIQTAPTAVNRRSLFARVQQFASRVYSPMFAAGLHYWQLGDGQYWGHNTIIRIAPFMDHCGLPRLAGKPPLGGEIMSHDFVEAALMGRAGWMLWLAYDLPGSYEEVPSTLLEEMKRDRRWCQGNLQHLRLLFTEGLFGAHRALFINGVLSYVSALLWFTFLTLSTAEAILNALREHEYFPHGRSLFPEWPVWRPDWALDLMAVTAMILFLPKLLSIVVIVVKGRNAKAYGGVIRLVCSVVLEIILSSLLAPIRMVFHSRFVVQNLLGRTVTWRSQGREDAETGWREAIRHHGLDTLFASAWGIALYWLNPNYFWWVTPIIGALFLSVPTSVLASRVRLGERARRWRLFLIPEESEPPQELRDLEANLRQAQAASAVNGKGDGFVRAQVKPYVNALHRVLLRGPRSLKPSIRARRQAMAERALAGGPAAVPMPKERKMLLYDPDLTTDLHYRLWACPDRERAGRWIKT